MTPIDSNDPLYSKRLREISAEEMRQVIRNLSPKDEMHAGVRFPRSDAGGERGGGRCRVCRKGDTKILDEEGKLLDYDFVSDFEKRLLKRSHPNVLDRRTFLHTVGLGVAGGVGVPYYSTDIASKIWTRLVNPNQTNNFFARTHDWIGRYLVPPAEVLISASLVNEMVVNWRETKLEEVSNAVAEAVEAFRKIGSRKRQERG